MSVTITMPQLGETVTEGTILEWVKEIGDTVAEDEILVEISTDKVDTEVPSPASGVLSEILVAAGETVDVGTPLAVLTTDGAEGESPELTGESPEPIAQSPEAEEAEAAASDAPHGRVLSPVVRKLAAEHDIDLAVVAGTGDGGRITRKDVEALIESGQSAAPDPSADSPRRGVLSPVVRKLASEHGVDLAAVTGSGDGGRITRRDVEAFVAVSTAQAPAAPAPSAPAPAPAPPVPVAGGAAEVREIPRLRQRIAENLRNVKDTATHVWTSVEVDYTNVERVRQAHRDEFKAAEGFSLTYLPFIARATMDALNAYPVVNSQFDLDAGTWTFHRAVHLGIAVDLNQDGLVVTNVRDADGMRLKGLARSIRSMAVATRDKKASPDDLAGYTFTITNPGPFGSFMSAPIIAAPNSAILSTDTVSKKPAVIELPDGTDAIAIRHIGYLGLSWDHRVFDGSTAVLFLDRIKQNLQTWDWEQELS